MKRFFQIWTALLAVLALQATTLTAADLTDTQRTKLDARIAQFGEDIRAGDMHSVGNALPPRLIDVMTEKFNLTRDELVQAIATALEQGMQNVTIDEFGLLMAEAPVAETEAGRPYLLIPTHTDFTINDGTKVETRSRTLAFIDNDVWYLVRTADAHQMELLVEAYPDFKGVRFPGPETRILNE